MGDTILVPIPVSREAAEALGDASRRERMGRLVSAILKPSTPEVDPIRALIAEVKAEARADGLTDADIEAELAAWHREGRV